MVLEKQLDPVSRDDEDKILTVRQAAQGAQGLLFTHAATNTGRRDWYATGSPRPCRPQYTTPPRRSHGMD
jgi:hypothetical protein